jgi:hypothetical protein
MISRDVNELSIGVLTPPVGVHSLIPLSNLINILSEISDSSLYLITGNEGYEYYKNNPNLITYGVSHEGTKNDVIRTLKFFTLQLRISFALLRVIKKCDVWIFFLGGENMILPMLTAKIFRKKVILMFAGSSVHTLYYDSLVPWLQLLTTLNCRLCNKIILYSKNLVSECS